MTAKTQGPDGCWTCRVRRKKCDARRPVCDGCVALEIDCLYSNTKPEWMDNGPRQKAMADLLKTEVKKRAAWRREKRYAQAIENGTATVSLAADSFGELIITSLPRAAAPASAEALEISTASPSSSRIHQEQNLPTPPDDQLAVPHPFSAEATESPGLLMADMPPVFTTSSSSSSELGRAVLLSDAQIAGIDIRLQPFVATLAAPSLEQERELTFIMKYLDYVFPFLYPFYRPSLLGFGRGWLLVLLMKNKAVFHSALSLASYFFTVSIGQLLEEHDSCKRHIAAELHKQQELSLRELQCNIGEIRRRGVRGYLAESARAVESIIQLLYFEAIISPRDSCYVHLDAAIVLFEQIMENHAVTSPTDFATAADSLVPKRYSWRLIMDRLSSFLAGTMDIPTSEPVPYNSDQAALRFYTSVLLYIDILTSTIMDIPPRLRRYHSTLIHPLGNMTVPSDNTATHPNGENNSELYLDIDGTIGIQNWVLLGLSEVSALAAWKKEAVQTKKLSVTELVQRASPIETELRGRLAYYETRMTAGGWTKIQDDAISTVPGLFPPSYLPETETGLRASDSHAANSARVSSEAISLIWGYAALTYHLVVVNGWQPESDAIRQSVDRTLQLITNLPSSSWLRTVAWPFCVTGCLATQAQESVFREMVGRICGLEVFGSVREALRIMEAVWAERASIEHGQAEWSVAKCFHILGRRAFMV